MTTALFFLKTEFRSGLFLVLIVIVFNAFTLWPEFAASTQSLNEEVLHLSSSRLAVQALEAGYDPTDFWLPHIGLGFPLFRHYQHLPQVVLAAINFFTSSFFSLERLMDFSRYFLLVFFPVVVFWAARRIGFSSLPAGLSGFVSSLVSTNGLFGLEYGSYLWRGAGLYTQLWAMFFLPVALAEIYYRLTRGKGSYFFAVFFSVIVFLSNLTYGIILFLSAILINVLTKRKSEIVKRFRRFCVVCFLIAVSTAYFWIPLLVDSAYWNRSVWEHSYKYDSFGLITTLKNLFTGKLLDFDRIPALTLLFFLSLAILIFRLKEERSRFVVILTGAWFLLYLGRSLWGPLLDLPLVRNLHFHRFVGGFQLGAIMVIGAGCSSVWQLMKGVHRRMLIVIPCAAFFIFAPVFIERFDYYRENNLGRAENRAAFGLMEKEISDIFGSLKSLPPGRVFAGFPGSWGNYPYYQVGFTPLYAFLAKEGIDSVGYAYQTPIGADIMYLFNEQNHIEYNIFNIRYVLLHKTWSAPDYYSLIKEFSNYRLYEVETSGYFDLVDAEPVLFGRTGDIYGAAKQWFASAMPALKIHPRIKISDQAAPSPFHLTKVDASVLNNLSIKKEPAGEILNEKIGLNYYAADIKNSRSVYAMLKSNYHPRWRASLDGHIVKPEMLMPGFLGIEVGPGTHRVVFFYKSSPFRPVLFALGFLNLAVFSFYNRRKENYRAFV